VEAAQRAADRAARAGARRVEAKRGQGSGGTTCHYEYMVIEVSYDDGKTWSVLWEGTTAVCE
jgi:copper homeostasis protein CutC